MAEAAAACAGRNSGQKSKRKNTLKIIEQNQILTDSEVLQ
jgi:hypothetical protein